MSGPGACSKKRYYSAAEAGEILIKAKIALAMGHSQKRKEDRMYVCGGCTIAAGQGVWHLTSAPKITQDESEGSFMKWCIDLFKSRRWMITHVRTSMTLDGRHITAYQGDSGLPDLIALRGGVSLLAELKREDGAVTPGQQLWIDQGAYLWRPSDRPEIARIAQ